MTTSPRFGISVIPTAHRLAEAVELAQSAEEAGLDFVSVLDHPYNPVLGEAWTMITALAMCTERIAIQLAVACMPLRQPAILAKQVATLQQLVGNRIEIGLGAGAALDGVVAYGGPRLTNPEAYQSLREQMQIMRALWGGRDVGDREHRVGHYEGFGRALSETVAESDWNAPISFEGRHHRLVQASPGPIPTARIPLFVGGYGPKMLRMSVELGDGAAVSLGRLDREGLATVADRLDTAAAEFDKDPSTLIRMYNVFGTIGEKHRTELGGRAGLSGTADDWSDVLADVISELRFNTIQYFPHDDVDRMRRFAEDVVPATRARLSSPAVATPQG